MKNLFQFIPRGREGATTARELARMVGGVAVRDVTRAIHDLRLEGKIILSSTSRPAGYFRPASDWEVQKFSRSMHNRIKEIGQAVRSADDYLSGGDVDG